MPDKEGFARPNPTIQVVAIRVDGHGYAIIWLCYISQWKMSTDAKTQNRIGSSKQIHQ